MADNIVAYRGIDNFDIILYLSFILSKLNKKVLVADRSDSMALKSAMPKPQGMDLNNEIVTFRHVDLTAQPLSKNIMDKYDTVLISCGFAAQENEIPLYTRTIYVTDLYKNNIERINNLQVTDTNKKSLLVRNVVGVKISPEIIAENIDKQILPEEISSLYIDENDQESAIICQYNQTFTFDYVSSQMKAYLIKETGKLYPELSADQLKKAYKLARRGE